MSLKILHIGPSEVPILSKRGGAVQRRIWELARVQAAQGLDVTIVSPAECDGVEMRAGVRIVWLGLRTRRPLRDYELLARTRRFFEASRCFNVLHAHGSPDACRVLGCLADSAVQSVDYFRYRASLSRVGHAYYTLSLNRYGAIMPVSRYCAEEFLNFYPGVTAPLMPVPNGVDLQQFAPDQAAAKAAREALRLPPGDLVVYLGRVCHQKGSDLLAPLALAVAGIPHDVSVVAVGPPDQFGRTGRSDLMEALTSAGVRCTGAIHEDLLSGVLNAATIVVLPTRQDEMFGMAALEGVACGTPVVASDLGGIPEAVGDAGTLFPVGDVAAFVSSVKELLDDPQRLTDLSSRALIHATAFSWDQISAMTSQVYELALDQA